VDRAGSVIAETGVCSYFGKENGEAISASAETALGASFLPLGMCAMAESHIG